MNQDHPDKSDFIEPTEGPDMYVDFDVEADGEEPARAEDRDAMIERLAHEVLRGEHGRGDERRQYLGDDFEEVMSRVMGIRTQGR